MGIPIYHVLKLALKKRKKCRAKRKECVEFELQNGSAEFMFQRIPRKLGNGTHIHFCHDAGPVSTYGC